MKITDIKVTPENHSEWNRELNRWHPDFKKMLKAHNSLNEYLDSQLGGRLDWAGHYATWLNRLGIHHETKYGWWSKQAVNPENIKLFLREQKSDLDLDSEFHYMIFKSKDFVKKALTLGFRKTYGVSAKTVIETITEKEIPEWERGV